MSLLLGMRTLMLWDTEPLAGGHAAGTPKLRLTLLGAPEHAHSPCAVSTLTVPPPIPARTPLLEPPGTSLGSPKTNSHFCCPGTKETGISRPLGTREAPQILSALSIASHSPRHKL